MFKRRDTKSATEYVELPTGIFTASGVWFHTTEDAVRDFAGEIVEMIGFTKLLDQAIVWSKSADGIAALVFLALLSSVGPAMAVIFAVLAHYAWYTFLPVVVSPSFTPLLRLISSVAFQGILYIVVLSIAGNAGDTIGALTGLVWFMLIRWGLVSKAVIKLSDSIGKPEMPKPDGVLRSLIVRHAIGRKVTLSSTESFESRIREIWLRGKQK